MATYTPKRINRWNRLDDIGALLDVKRNPDEDNTDYRDRLLSVYTNRAGAHYAGQINALNTTFGVSKYTSLSITNTAMLVAPYKYSVHITASAIVLTDTSSSTTISYFYTQEDDRTYCKTLGELVDDINAVTNWTASLIATSYKDHSAHTLQIQSSIKLVSHFVVPATRRINLNKSNVVETSLTFNEKDVFKIEIDFDSTLDDPYSALSEEGDYTVDYINGIIYCYSIPRGYGRLQFKHRITPYVTISTPCNIYAFNDSEFLDALYMQSDGNEYYPSRELLRYIRELFVNHKQTWGK